MADLQQIGRALQGFGAGVRGRGPEFIQGLQTQRKQMSDERRDAALLDNRVLLDHLKSGRVPQARQLLTSRLQTLQQIDPNADPSDTQDMLNLIDIGQIPLLTSEAEVVDREAVIRGLLPAMTGGADFGRVVSGVQEGKPVFFQAGKSGQTNVLEGLTPPRSDAAIALEQKKLEAGEKKALRDEAARQQAGIVSSDITRALEQSTGIFTTGFTGSIASAVPGTPAFDLKNTLTGIKANIGFNKLQQMRESSPTGGALGQVSDNENRLLQSVLGSVEQAQSDEQFKRNLSRVKVIFDAVIHGTQPIPFTQKQFDAIPSGATFISPDLGTLVRKP